METVTETPTLIWFPVVQKGFRGLEGLDDDYGHPKVKVDASIHWGLYPRISYFSSGDLVLCKMGRFGVGKLQRRRAENP